MQDVTPNLPPGPSENLGAGVFRAQCPLELFSGLVRDHGNIVHVRMGEAQMVVLNEPDLSEGQEHRSQRKMMASTFSPRAVKSFSGETVRIAQQHASDWPNGTNNVLDYIGELTLDVVCQTLFGCRVDNSEVQTMRHSLSILKKSGGLAATKESDVPAALLAEFKEALAALDSAVLKLVAARQKQPGNDIMSHLISLKDDESRGLDDKALRDHAMALMLAGHDSTADAICWALYLLAKHPEAQDKAWREADTLSSNPDEQSSDTLPYGRQVFAEGMRLYPPSWIISRQTMDTYQLGPYTLPAQTFIRMPQWVTHRDPRFFPEPEKFDPDRWLPEVEQRRPKFSYYPFWGGKSNLPGSG